MKSRGAAAQVTVASALAISSSCSGDLPGRSIGTFRVVMHLEENTCGPAALPLDDGYAYAAELRAEEPRGYWRVPRIGPMEGTYQDGAFRFMTAATLELGSVDAGTAGCRLIREELLRGTVEVSVDGADASKDAEAADTGSPTNDAEAGDAGSPTNDAETGDAGADAGPPLRGEHTISFYPDATGRCAGAQGPLGNFERLPCSARYTITGTARDSF